jgi:DNA segregation ATPase FtsK/SpoIIIE, S-DNA-T family
MTDPLVPDEYDAETIEERPAPPGAPVDPPPHRRTFAAVVSRPDPVRPIIPASLRSPQQRRQLASWAVRFGAHRTAYHATRSPKYTAKVLFWAPVGVFRGVWRILRWCFDLESFSIRQDAANRNDVEAYLKLSRQRDQRVGRRLWVALPGAAVLAVAVVLLLTVAPYWWRWAVLAVALPALAWVGRPLDRPIVDRVHVGQAFIRLTAELTRAAIVAAGAGVKDPAGVKFPREIYRDGPGHTAMVDLPPGVVATDVIDKRDRLAAGFRLPLDQVWPDVVRGEHPGRLQIWVADRPVSAMRQPPWSLLQDGTADYFAPFPYGADVRLRPVSWRLDERNSLFGGVPGSGKSLAARVVLLGAVLDPLVIPAISELKGSGDYDMFEDLCPPGLYVSGADDGAIRRSVRIIEWIHQLCEERGPLVAQYARQGLNSVKKLNRAMAERDERLRPVVAMFDEYQELNSHPEVGKYASAMLMSAVKRGRAFGIHVIVATQRFDKDSLPKAISSLVTNRACLAVPAQPETDMVLGTSAYRTGARPTAFVPGEDSGWMVRAGFVPGFETVRSAFVDDQAAAAVCARALTMRRGADAPAVPRVRARNLAADVRQVWPEGVTGWWLADILAALQGLDDAYADMDKDALSAALRAADVVPVPIHRKIEGKGVTLHGIQLDRLMAAISDSERRAIDSAPDIARDQRKRR